MKISVIVPFWNSEKWLGRCLESLTRQEGDFEFLLVDDYSTDNGKKIALEYAHNDDRIRVMDNLRTKGVSGARNTGLDHSTGDWVTFLDADDEYIGEAYKTFKSVIESDPGAQMHQLNHMRHYAKLDKTVFKYANGSGRYDIDCLPQIWFGVWNKLFRAGLVKDIRYDERLQYGEDGLFVLECLAKTYIHHAIRDAVVVKHNFINAESLSKSKTPEAILKQIHVYEEFMLRQDSLDMKKAVCNEIALLWSVRRVKCL